MAAEAQVLSHWLEELRSDLYGRTLPFWLSHSVDAAHGGFFNCLDEDGGVTDTSKHIWLQGRQCWMWAKLANAHPADGELEALAARYAAPGSAVGAKPARSKADVAPVPFTRASLVAAARAGVQFLRDHAVRKEDGKVYFCLSREGKPVMLQRKPFAATFLIMALNEVGKATGEPALQAEARALTDTVLGWVSTLGSLREPMEGAPSYSPLNVPMIMLSVIGELEGSALPSPAPPHRDYARDKAWCVSEIVKHIHPEKRIMLENVCPDGSFDFSWTDGRVYNPGHAIEAGWFLLEHARKTGDAALKATALGVIADNFAAGWDDEAHGGGIIYFKDAEGYTPPQLEWSMKLWWPVNEAMIAFAMAYEETLDSSYLDRFVQVAAWGYKHLVDRKHGEWFGYANREGVVTHRFKGGAYKGCFHVPRALMMCEALLASAQAKLAARGSA